MNKKSVLHKQQHALCNMQFSSHVLSIVSRLQKNNHQAYIVGGAIRDLLLGIKPKDFDVATSATPEQVHQLFERSRIIGRRFKIVHVGSRKDVIEVATFRASQNKKQLEKNQTQAGLLLVDNNYGTLEEDAERRDFSINALYYNPADESIIDFCNGIDAIHTKQLRVIGEPEVRFREDPVRMLRAIRLASKLPITIDDTISTLILKNADLLRQVSPARLFDEVLKLLMNGFSEKGFNTLDSAGLLKELFPGLANRHNTCPQTKLLFTHAFRNSDTRVRAGKPISPGFIFAVLLWPETNDQFNYLTEKNPQLIKQEAWHHSMQNTIFAQNTVTHIPKRFQQMIKEIWVIHQRLIRLVNNTKRAKSSLTHPRFRAAYDFLLLREQAQQLPSKDAGQWWQKFQIEHAHILEKAKSERDKLRQDRYKKRTFKTPRTQ